MMQKRFFYDFHTHTSFREGSLIPSELVQRLYVLGCRIVAITDHADSSNLETAVSNILKFIYENQNSWEGMIILPGVELTHVPPKNLGKSISKARQLGAKWVVVHGETLSEPVAKGTNISAIENKADLLAHPGLISEREAELAAKNGVYLEITTRHKHCWTNGWVAKIARQTGAKLLLNSDTHSSIDILDFEKRNSIAKGCGLDDRDVRQIWQNGKDLFESKFWYK